MDIHITSEWPNTIPWKVYCSIVEKVTMQNKGVFRDFIKSGSAFKLAVFVLLNKIYSSEIIPESMHVTKLTQLYKKWGSINSIKNYRFIHQKDWPGKLIEKCLMKIVENELHAYCE